MPYPISAPTAKEKFDLFDWTEANITSGVDGLLTFKDKGIFVSDLTKVTNDGARLKVDSQGALTEVVVKTDVPKEFTFEFQVSFSKLPVDLQDLLKTRLYIAAYDAAGKSVGLVFSKAGIAIISSFLPNPLPLYGSDGLVPLATSLVFRAAITQGVLDLYVTVKSQLSLTGHVLRYSTQAPISPGVAFDSVVIQALGSAEKPVTLHFETLRLAASSVIPNKKPIADAGVNTVVPVNSVVRLNGKKSSDPEGASLTYKWKILKKPEGSKALPSGGVKAKVTVGDGDGAVVYTAKKPGDAGNLLKVEVLSPIQSQDLSLEVGSSGTKLTVKPQALSAVSGPITTAKDLVKALTNLEHPAYKKSVAEVFSAELPAGKEGNDQIFVVAETALAGGIDSTDSQPTFVPDKVGLYEFQLTVSDGEIESSPAKVLVNALEDATTIGELPDAEYVWGYVSDFFRMLEDKGVATTFYSAVLQVLGSEVLKLWQRDYAKSIRDIPRRFQRRWLSYPLHIKLPKPPFKFPGKFLEKDGVGYSGTFTVPTGTELTTKVLAGTGLKALEIVKGDFIAVGGKANLVQQVVDDTTIELASAVERYTVQDSGVNGRTDDDPDADGKASKLHLIFGVFQKAKIQAGDTLRLDGIGDFTILTAGSDFIEIDLVLHPGGLPVSKFGITWKVIRKVVSYAFALHPYFVYPGVEDLKPKKGDLLVFEAPRGDLVYTDIQGISGSTVGFTYTPLKDGVAALSIKATDPSIIRFERTSKIPVDPDIVSIPRLQSKFKDPALPDLLVENNDYTIADAEITLLTAPYALTPGPSQRRPPPELWGEVTYFDNRKGIFENFGWLVGLPKDALEEADYLTAVRGLHFAFFGGPKVSSIKLGAHAFVGLPLTDRAGKVVDVDPDYSSTHGRILVEDKLDPAIIRSFKYPLSAGLAVNPKTGKVLAEDDEVDPFTLLSKGISVEDWVNTPTWPQPFIAQGLMTEPEKFFLFKVEVDLTAIGAKKLDALYDLLVAMKPIHSSFYLVGVKPVAEDAAPEEQSTFKAKLFFVDVPMATADKDGAGAYVLPKGYNPVFDDHTGEGKISVAFDTSYKAKDIAKVFNLEETDPDFNKVNEVFRFDQSETLGPASVPDLRHGFVVPLGGALPAFDSGLKFDDYLYDYVLDKWTKVPNYKTGHFFWFDVKLKKHTDAVKAYIDTPPTGEGGTDPLFPEPPWQPNGAAPDFTGVLATFPTVDFVPRRGDVGKPRPPSPELKKLPAPVPTDVTTAAQKQAAAGATVSFEGYYFEDGVTVKFATTTVTATFPDQASKDKGIKINAVVPAGSGTVDLLFTNPNGSSFKVRAGFKYV